jgi:hypothetical protein
VLPQHTTHLNQAEQMHMGLHSPTGCLLQVQPTVYSRTQQKTSAP